MEILPTHIHSWQSWCKSFFTKINHNVSTVNSKLRCNLTNSEWQNFFDPPDYFNAINHCPMSSSSIVFKIAIFSTELYKSIISGSNTRNTYTNRECRIKMFYCTDFTSYNVTTVPASIICVFLCKYLLSNKIIKITKTMFLPNIF